MQQNGMKDERKGNRLQIHENYRVFRQQPVPAILPLGTLDELYVANNCEDGYKSLSTGGTLLLAKK
jgi:hypothetical protein